MLARWSHSSMLSKNPTQPGSSSPDRDRGTKQAIAMKRKRSSGLPTVEPRKKATKNSRGPGEAKICPLIQVLQQYGLLTIIVSTLLPEDLLALALASKAIYNAISPRPGSLENLLGKLSCPSKGILIREAHHKKSTFFYAYNCTEHVQCGSSNSARKVESRPCYRCKVTTCDECRIHCVYQSNYETPNDVDELPNFSGFVLLSPHEVPILSPEHLSLHLESGCSWQDPSHGRTGPYHDQGFLDVPFNDDNFGLPECVEGVLDLDLGQNSLAISVTSNVPAPSPVLKSFHQVTEQRKRWFCDGCLPDDLEKRRNRLQSAVCECTLRKRILERWLCLRCYVTENTALEKSHPSNLEHCGCGTGPSSAICLWCSGIVLEPRDALQDSDWERESIADESLP